MISAAVISPRQPHDFLLGLRPAAVVRASAPVLLSCYLCSSFACLVRARARCVVRVSYLEQGAVALQPGGAERGHGAEAAPEVDARQQRTVRQQQTGGSLRVERGEEDEAHE